MVASITKSGRHEVGVHGWIHETPTRVTADEEERLLDRAIDYLTNVTGKRPVGVWFATAEDIVRYVKAGK